MSHLWSGRFDAPPDPDAFDFGRSFSVDRRLFEDDVTGSLAWAEALADAGVLSNADAGAIDRGLREILDRGLIDPGWVSGDDEDVHSFVERQLIDIIGEAGRRLHTGRSRNEQVSLDLRLYLRRRIPLLQQRIGRLIDVLLDQASSAGGAVMPAYTHLRRAMPVLVAHFLLGHAAALRRDHARLAYAASEADALPLGAGAVAGTNYAVDTTQLARRLGFSRVVANSIDASSDRDFALSFLNAASIAMVHLSRLAEDVILLTSEEFGFFELSDRSATGSSMMPQKKNPDPLELVRGKAGRVIGHSVGLLTTLKGLPSGYNKDLQEDKDAVFDTEDTLVSSFTAATSVVRDLTLRPERTRLAASGLLLATDVADHLVAHGVPFREAHEIVGGLVRRLLQEGRTFDGLSVDQWAAVHPAFAGEMAAVIAPESSVRARRTPQSTHPDAVAAAVEELRAWRTADPAAVSAR